MSQISLQHTMQLLENDIAVLSEDRSLNAVSIFQLAWKFERFLMIFNDPSMVDRLIPCCISYINLIAKYSLSLNNPNSNSHKDEVCKWMGALNALNSVGCLRNVLLKDVIHSVEDFLSDPSLTEIFMMELMRFFNSVARNTDTDIRYEICNDATFLIHKLADVLSFCKCYEYQALVIETIFLMCSLKRIGDLSASMFPGVMSLQHAIRKFNTKDFDKSSRSFLNTVNSIYRNISSVVANNVLLDEVAVSAPMDEQNIYHPLWIDFNKNSLSFFCDRNSLSMVSSQDRETVNWELVTIFYKDIVKTEHERSTNSKNPSLTLKLFLDNNDQSFTYCSSTSTFKIISLEFLGDSTVHKMLNEMLPYISQMQFEENSQNISENSSLMLCLMTPDKKWKAYTNIQSEISLAAALTFEVEDHMQQKTQAVPDSTVDDMILNTTSPTPLLSDTSIHKSRHVAKSCQISAEMDKENISNCQTELTNNDYILKSQSQRATTKILKNTSYDANKITRNENSPNKLNVTGRIISLQETCDLPDSLVLKGISKGRVTERPSKLESKNCIGKENKLDLNKVNITKQDKASKSISVNLDESSLCSDITYVEHLILKGDRDDSLYSDASSDSTNVGNERCMDLESTPITIIIEDSDDEEIYHDKSYIMDTNNKEKLEETIVTNESTDQKNSPSIKHKKFQIISNDEQSELVMDKAEFSHGKETEDITGEDGENIDGLSKATYLQVLNLTIKSKTVSGIIEGAKEYLGNNLHNDVKATDNNAELIENEVITKKPNKDETLKQFVDITEKVSQKEEKQRNTNKKVVDNNEEITMINENDESNQNSHKEQLKQVNTTRKPSQDMEKLVEVPIMEKPVEFVLASKNTSKLSKAVVIGNEIDEKLECSMKNLKKFKNNKECTQKSSHVISQKRNKQTKQIGKAKKDENCKVVVDNVILDEKHEIHKESNNEEKLKLVQKFGNFSGDEEEKKITDNNCTADVERTKESNKNECMQKHSIAISTNLEKQSQNTGSIFDNEEKTKQVTEETGPSEDLITEQTEQISEECAVENESFLKNKSLKLIHQKGETLPKKSENSIPLSSETRDSGKPSIMYLTRGRLQRDRHITEKSETNTDDGTINKSRSPKKIGTTKMTDEGLVDKPNQKHSQRGRPKKVKHVLEKEENVAEVLDDNISSNDVYKETDNVEELQPKLAKGDRNDQTSTNQKVRRPSKTRKNLLDGEEKPKQLTHKIGSAQKLEDEEMANENLVDKPKVKKSEKTEQVINETGLSEDLIDEQTNPKSEEYATVKHVSEKEESVAEVLEESDKDEKLQAKGDRNNQTPTKPKRGRPPKTRKNILDGKENPKQLIHKMGSSQKLEDEQKANESLVDKTRMKTSEKPKQVLNETGLSEDLIDEQIEQKSEEYAKVKHLSKKEDRVTEGLEESDKDEKWQAKGDGNNQTPAKRKIGRPAKTCKNILDGKENPQQLIHKIGSCQKLEDESLVDKTRMKTLEKPKQVINETEDLIDEQTNQKSKEYAKVKHLSQKEESVIEVLKEFDKDEKLQPKLTREDKNGQTPMNQKMGMLQNAHKNLDVRQKPKQLILKMGSSQKLEDEEMANERLVDAAMMKKSEKLKQVINETGLFANLIDEQIEQQSDEYAKAKHLSEKAESTMEVLEESYKDEKLQQELSKGNKNDHAPTNRKVGRPKKRKNVFDGKEEPKQLMHNTFSQKLKNENETNESLMDKPMTEKLEKTANGENSVNDDLTGFRNVEVQLEKMFYENDGISKQKQKSKLSYAFEKPPGEMNNENTTNLIDEQVEKKAEDSTIQNENVKKRKSFKTPKNIKRLVENEATEESDEDIVNPTPPQFCSQLSGTSTVPLDHEGESIQNSNVDNSQQQKPIVKKPLGGTRKKTKWSIEEDAMNDLLDPKLHRTLSYMRCLWQQGEVRTSKKDNYMQMEHQSPEGTRNTIKPLLRPKRKLNYAKDTLDFSINDTKYDEDVRREADDSSDGICEQITVEVMVHNELWRDEEEKFIADARKNLATRKKEKVIKLPPKKTKTIDPFMDVIQVVPSSPGKENNIKQKSYNKTTKLPLDEVNHSLLSRTSSPVEDIVDNVVVDKQLSNTNKSEFDILKETDITEWRFNSTELQSVYANKDTSEGHTNIQNDEFAVHQDIEKKSSTKRNYGKKDTHKKREVPKVADSKITKAKSRIRGRPKKQSHNLQTTDDNDTHRTGCESQVKTFLDRCEKKMKSQNRSYFSKLINSFDSFDYIFRTGGDQEDNLIMTPLKTFAQLSAHKVSTPKLKTPRKRKLRPMVIDSDSNDEVLPTKQQKVHILQNIVIQKPNEINNSNLLEEGFPGEESNDMNEKVISNSIKQLEVEVTFLHASIPKTEKYLELREELQKIKTILNNTHCTINSVTC